MSVGQQFNALFVLGYDISSPRDPLASRSMFD